MTDRPKYADHWLWGSGWFAAAVVYGYDNKTAAWVFYMNLALAVFVGLVAWSGRGTTQPPQ